MKKWKIIGSCLLLFISGAVAGIFANSLYLHHKIPRMMKRGAGYYIEKKIIPRLELTGDQKEEIDPIVTEIGGRLSRYRDEYRSGYRKILDRGFARLAEHLNSEQIEELNRIRDEKKKRRDRKKN